MPALTISAAVREVINGDVNVSADDIVRLVRDKGVTANESSVRDAIYNVKSDLRKSAKKLGAKVVTKPVPAAARATKKHPPAPAKTVTPAALTVTTSPALDVRAVLANVALVNDVLGTCGGAEVARKVVDAVQACGGVEPFLLHLDLVAQLRPTTT